jgi:acyl-CoA reductase-like NAD-dependent aldehyde dehydrogenase
MKFCSINPTTGECLHTHIADTSETITAKVKQAQVAQLDWASMPSNDRIGALKKLKHVIEVKMPEILDLIYRETGKLPADSSAEVYDVLDAFDYYDRQYSNLTMPLVEINSEAFPMTKAWLEYSPFGVLALIMPWNFSFYSPMMFVIAGATAGNAIVIKPSEHSTLVGLMIRDLWIEAGLPHELLQIVVGDESVGRKLVKSSCDKIFFVGSVDGGKNVIANAGITPVQVELGGNSAAIVMPDADLDLAAQAIAWGGTYNSGQDCAGIKRVYAHSSIAVALQERLVKIVRLLRQGIDYGPYISEEARSIVADRLVDAKAKGAEILIGGEVVNPGFWLNPSVVRISDDNTPLVSEETFGNVLPLMLFEDEETLVKHVNGSKYGLSNAIFSADNNNALRLGRKLHGGMIFINDSFVTPVGWDHWTGWKNSGFGTMDSKLNQCLRKRLCSSGLHKEKRSFWYPYSE